MQDVFSDTSEPRQHARLQAGGNGVHLTGSADDDPVDLLEPTQFRAMQTYAAGQAAPSREADFPMDGARMVINEDAPQPRLKRKRGGGIDTAASDDSDFDDLHHIRGATAALRLDSQSKAGSLATKSGLKSVARSTGGRTFAARSSAGSFHSSLHCTSSMAEKANALS